MSYRMSVSKRKIAIFSLITLGLFLTVFFIVGEITSRILHKQKHDQIAARNPEALYAESDNPKLVYEYRRNTNGTNSQGYFDEEHTFVKKSDTYRIVVIGDSIAAGHGVERKKAFPELMEAMLKTKNNTERNTEVIVLARAGYAMSQEMELLEKEAFLYDPDLIVWSYCLNDPANPIYHFGNSEMGLYFYNPDSYFISYIKRILFLSRETLLSKNLKREYHQILHGVYFKDIKNMMYKIKKLTESNNIPIVFVIHPVFEEKNNYDEYSHRNIHDSLSALVNENNFYLIDLLDKYKGLQPSDLKIDKEHWYDPWHPNELGHRIAAEALVDMISTEALQR